MLEKMQKYRRELLEKCNHYEHIYLYGAGTYGEAFYFFLTEKGIKIEGFITSYGGEIILDTPILKAQNILPKLGSESLVILSLREELQSEILAKQEFACDVLTPTDMQIAYIDMERIFEIREIKAQNKDVKSNSILVIQLEVTFGDMIWSTALLRELRRAYPESIIDYVINKKFVGLYKNCPYINHIYEYDCSLLNERISDKMFARVQKYISENFNTTYSKVFLPRLMPLSGADACENIVLALETGASNIYGHGLYFLDYQKLRCDLLAELYSGVIRHTKPEHETMNDLALLSLVDKEVQNNRMELWPTNDCKVIDDEKIKICVALVGSISSRSWKPEYYAEVFNNILAKYNDVEIILCGGNDAVEAAKIVQVNTNNRCIDITGKTSLTDVVDLFSKCQIYIGSDTGLMHVASAFNQCVIEICASNKTSPDYWGCTPTRTGPWCDNYAVLQPEKPLDDCKYMCFKPYAHCINQNSPDEVLIELENAISIVKRLN